MDYFAHTVKLADGDSGRMSWWKRGDYVRRRIVRSGVPLGSSGGNFSTHAFKLTRTGLDTFLPSPGPAIHITSFHCRVTWSAGAGTCAGCRIAFRGTGCDVSSACTIRTQQCTGGTNKYSSTGIVLGWSTTIGAYLTICGGFLNTGSCKAPCNHSDQQPRFYLHDALPAQDDRLGINIPKPVEWNFKLYYRSIRLTQVPTKWCGSCLRWVTQRKGIPTPILRFLPPTIGYGKLFFNQHLRNVVPIGYQSPHNPKIFPSDFFGIIINGEGNEVFGVDGGRILYWGVIANEKAPPPRRWGSLFVWRYYQRMD